jgi:hypothetical protein
VLLLTVGPRHRPHELAFAESAALLHLAEAEQAVVAGAWVLPDGPRVCLGALQVAGRVLHGVDPATVTRRATSGAAVHVDGGVLLSLALPSLDAIHRDATPRTVLNRNVRPLLAGLRHAGIAATYLGRDFISVERRPAALLGLDGTRSGAILVEALMTARGSLALPRARVTDLEAGTQRLRGLEPLSLELLRARDLEKLAGDVLEGIADRLGAEREPREVDAPALDAVLGPTSPLASSARLLEPVPIPMGWLDLAVVDGLPWIGGDALAPTYALGHSFELGGFHVPMEGAVWDDVRRAATSFAAA